jgi:hypothetical protein
MHLPPGQVWDMHPTDLATCLDVLTGR